MAEVPAPVTVHTTLSVASERLQRSQYGMLPLVDHHGTYRGVLTVQAVSDALADGTDDASTVESLAEMPSILREDEHVDEGIRALDLSGSGAVPVLAVDRDRVVGWFDYRAALSSFR
jgi:CIC family chloride channel protein